MPALSADDPRCAAFRQARLSRDVRFDGAFFVAVTSTGIFCRPVCPARVPQEQHVQYFCLAAQAMQAGFRPCLRCRPDSAPASPAWRGVGTTVQRAQHLLAAQPAQPVQQIAARLGISSRYLHQLLTREIGVAPKQLQLFNQLLLAKQLLQQTSLSITDVAAACSFRSARRLQHLLRQHWQLSPTQLRKHFVTTSVSAATQLFIACRQPYNWPQVQRFLRLHAIDAVEQFTADSYARAFCWQGSDGHILARYDNTAGGFQVTLHLDNPAFIQPVLANLRRMLDTDTDPQLIHTALTNSGLPEAHIMPGLRLPGTWDPFEAACRAVVGQQISMKAAVTYANQLAERVDASNAYGIVFPDAASVLAQPVDFLRMPATRQHTLRRLAEVFADNPTPSREALLAVKGIGPWTCDYWQLRGHNACDIYLHSDLVVRNTANDYALTPAAAAPWRSYLTLQLWEVALQQRAAT